MASINKILEQANAQAMADTMRKASEKARELLDTELTTALEAENSAMLRADTAAGARESDDSAKTHVFTAYRNVVLKGHENGLKAYEIIAAMQSTLHNASSKEALGAGKAAFNTINQYRSVAFKFAQSLDDAKGYEKAKADADVTKAETDLTYREVRAINKEAERGDVERETDDVVAELIAQIKLARSGRRKTKDVDGLKPANRQALLDQLAEMALTIAEMVERAQHDGDATEQAAVAADAGGVAAAA